MGKPSDLVQGTLDLLILKTTSLEPKHGWAIAKRIQQISKEELQVQQGSLYPALHRLEQQGWIKAHWGETEGGRKAKFYSLTRAGKRTDQVVLSLRSLLRRPQVEHELDDELRFHLEQQIEENIAAGMAPDDARYAARRVL